MKSTLFRRIWVLIACYGVGLYASAINRFRIHGTHHLPKSGGVMLAANHISGYETVFLPWAVNARQPLQMVWAPAKEELFRNPLLAFFFRSLGAFPVRRGRDVRAGKQLEVLLKHEKVMLFPEGTRNKDGRLGKGNRGVGKLIYDARPVVIPVTLEGLNRWRFPGIGLKGSVTFGPALTFDDLFQLENNRQTQQAIVDRVMDAIASQHPEHTEKGSLKP